MIYELKITLKDVGVPVWRKIQVDGNTTFYNLHRVLQVAFDWDNYHLHSFFADRTNGKRIDGLEITGEQQDDMTNLFGEQVSYKENDEILADWFKLSEDKVTYMYDFGDDWNHEIVLTKTLEPENGGSYPRCTGAKNRAPEEDTRGEVLMGEVDLTHPDEKQLLNDVNALLQNQLQDILTLPDQPSSSDDYWQEVLTKAKEFQKLKPWEVMFDEHIFAVEDPVTQEHIYCSVLGGGDEMFGLAVYIGNDGYRSLMAAMTEDNSNFEFVLNQRSLLMSFEDREDLEKEEYALIKSYDVPFRGRKSWPSFMSYKPGYYPWLMDDEEARLMLLGIERSFEVYEEIMGGLELPDMLFDEEVLVKVPREENGVFIFDNQVVGLEEEENDVGETVAPLAISELELKRVEKLKTMQASIEFSMEYVNMPVQEDPDQRPIFPLLVLAVDRTQGMAIYYNLLTESPDPGVQQSEFVKMIESLEGIPENIMIDHQTARVLEPLFEKVNINVDVYSDLPLIRQVMDMMYEDMRSF